MQEPKKVTVGPYVALQRVDVPNGNPDKAFPVNDAWALPGGRIVTTAQLQEIALRNGWKIGSYGDE